MLTPRSSVSLSNTLVVDERNKRLVVNGYAKDIKPALFSKQLIDLATEKKLEKIWLWALPTDISEFLRCDFRIEGNLFRGNYEEFAVSLAYYVREVRGYSDKLQAENEILQSVRAKPVIPLQRLPLGMELKLLDGSFAPQISQLLSQVFTSYPSSVEKPEYIYSLIQSGNIFAGAFVQEKLIAVAAAYPDPIFNRCEMTDCATLADFRGHCLSERLLSILEHEVQKNSLLCLYTLARAQSFSMNRVFHKLGYTYKGRLINNCHIAGSFEDMNVWVK